MIHITANAKLNLSLEIIGRRDDGFHNLVSIMQAIGLSDELVALPAQNGSIRLECNDPALADSEENTVLSAAHLLKDSAGVTEGARLLLRKSIPVAAGLGGGSTDGAAALVALNRLWQTGLSPNRLMELGAEVGSDVPFFLGDSPTALVEEQGATITTLPSVPPAWAVILFPKVPIPSPKTRALFRMLDDSLFGTGERTRELQSLIQDGAPAADIFSRVGSTNTFNDVAERAFPGIGRFRGVLARAVGQAANVGMSGAGPSLYAILSTHAQAREVVDELTQEGLTPLLADMAERPLTVLER